MHIRKIRCYMTLGDSSVIQCLHSLTSSSGERESYDPSMGSQERFVYLLCLQVLDINILITLILIVTVNMHKS